MKSKVNSRMDALLKEQFVLERKVNLSKSIQDVDQIIEQLSNARSWISSHPDSSSVTLAKLQNPMRQSFSVVNDDLKEVYNGLGKYSKMLDKNFKDKPLPSADHDALAFHHSSVDRALGMHLLREGQFVVAESFLRESGQDGQKETSAMELDTSVPTLDDTSAGRTVDPYSLRDSFSEMYHILEEMRGAGNLLPAISWARNHSSQLEARGSNLEFDLSKQQFIWLLTRKASKENDGSHSIRYPTAVAYARTEFGRFQDRYLREIQQLIGAMAFLDQIHTSPYRHLFNPDHTSEELAVSFTREFCALLGLSADSPLYIASTAGAIALPTLVKLQNIMKEKRTEWTTQHELPVEILLPSSYQFHSIFVCPVSKEQATDDNPPMMMPCGHVVAEESLNRLGKSGGKFKCPYCPGE
ncbi:hypothetical protein MMC25_003415, partial [Agyrium rufum]|nr:hypothetical protein [Agyrium rufum]